jgi:hypothetical protein
MPAKVHHPVTPSIKTANGASATRAGASFTKNAYLFSEQTCYSTVNDVFIRVRIFIVLTREVAVFGDKNLL